MSTYPIIDYFSFTVPIPCLVSQWETADRLGMGNLFDDRTSDLLEFMGTHKNWREEKISGRFPHVIRFLDSGMIYMEGEKSDVSLVQLPGEACAWLRDKELLDNVVAAWQDRSTRLDIAIDLDGDDDPEDFARNLSNKRFKTESMEKSNTGKTFYVGSYKSERFVRVYRYSDKLARRRTLRLEYQFGNGQAKYAAAMCRDAGVLALAIELGNLYGWRSPNYDLEKTNTKFTAPPRPKTRAGKEFWIYEQVLPSLIKEGQKGNVELLIDLRDKLCGIIEEYQVNQEV